MLENLTVSEIAVHEIFQRGADRKIVTPVYANHVEKLSLPAMTAFRMRVTDALSAKAKALQMQIIDHGPGHFQGKAVELLGASNDADFLNKSKAFADHLASAQKAQNIPGGIVIVFRGTTGAAQNPFVAVIKAEVQEGFRRSNVNGVLTTEFVNDLFMTKATRLYKIGFMTADKAKVDDQNAWKCLVFDHYIVANNREAAAIYFYEGFLGCAFMEDSAYETAKFFNLTREFATKNISDREARHNVQDSLYTYVKNDQAPTFTVDEFADRHLSMELKDQYKAFMAGRQFPERAIRRNTDELKGKLKRRRFKYENDIELSASPEAIANGLVKIETRAMEGDGKVEDVTVVTISAPFIKET